MSKNDIESISAAEVECAASIVDEAAKLVQKIDQLGREELDIISGILNDAVLESREALSKIPMNEMKKVHK